jgi:hypothetical protein
VFVVIAFSSFVGCWLFVAFSILMQISNGQGVTSVAGFRWIG